MNSHFNNKRAGITLLETLVMLAIFALVITVASSGFRVGGRAESPAGTLARIAQAITIARNDALRTGHDTRLGLTNLNLTMSRTQISLCDPDQPAQILLHSDGTVTAPDLCSSSAPTTRISIDWLTGKPTFSESNSDGR